MRAGNSVACAGGKTNGKSARLRLPLLFAPIMVESSAMHVLIFVRQGQDVHGHGALARAAPCHSSGETVLAPAGGRHIPASKLHHFYESDINDAAANQIIR